MNSKMRASLIVVGFVSVLLLIAAMVHWVIRPAFQELERSRALRRILPAATEAIMRLFNWRTDRATGQTGTTPIALPSTATPRTSTQTGRLGCFGAGDRRKPERRHLRQGRERHL